MGPMSRTSVDCRLTGTGRSWQSLEDSDADDWDESTQASREGLQFRTIYATEIECILNGLALWRFALSEHFYCISFSPAAQPLSRRGSNATWLTQFGAEQCCFDISEISKCRSDIDILYRIVSPAEISKSSIYRYHVFDTSACRIFIYSFIHSHLCLTGTRRVSISVSEVEVGRSS